MIVDRLRSTVSLVLFLLLYRISLNRFFLSPFLHIIMVHTTTTWSFNRLRQYFDDKVFNAVYAYFRDRVCMRTSKKLGTGSFYQFFYEFISNFNDLKLYILPLY